MTPVSPLHKDSVLPPEEDDPFGPSGGFADVRAAPDVDGKENPVIEASGEDERSDEVEETGKRPVPVPSPGSVTREQ